MKPRIQVLEIRDRNKVNGEPLAWLLVERQETSPRDGEESICLYYEQILPKFDRRRDGNRRCFSGGYSKDRNMVSLTSTSAASEGAVFLDLPGLEGQRIGTYLFNGIVTWAQRWPEATVNTVTLLGGQAYDANKARRNRFYERFGLVFDYADLEQREGKSLPMPAKALTPVETWKENIQERLVLDYLADIVYAETRASSELVYRERAIKDLQSDIKKAEAKPIRWVLRILWWHYAGIIVFSGAVITGMAVLIWKQVMAGV